MRTLLLVLTGLIVWGQAADAAEPAPEFPPGAPAPIQIDDVDRLRTWLRRGTIAERQNALARIAISSDVHLVDRDLIEAVLALVDDETYALASLRAARRMAQFDSTLVEGFTRRLLDAIKKGPEPERLEAVRVLGYARDSSKKVTAALEKIAANNDDAKLRAAALEALVRLRNPDRKALEKLTKDLQQPDAFVQQCALASLRELGPLAGPAVPAVGELMRDPGAESRQSAAVVLWKLDPEQARDAALVLAEVARDEKQQLQRLGLAGVFRRAEAVKMLAEIGVRDDAIAAVLQQLSFDDSEVLQEAAKDAYTRLTGRVPTRSGK
ncbi:MAG: HEAT repeat domain-containing protein [Planctomycetaceae bacterium]|nr:HEAT repeat domain-containing protein [Planctomycetaceae bacterium]